MRKQQKKYTNRDYLSYLDEPIYFFLTDTEAQKTFKKLHNKYKGVDLEKLNTIVLFESGLRLIKYKTQECFGKPQTKETCVELVKLSTSEKELEEAYNKYIDSLDSLEFLEWVANTMYWIAKLESVRLISTYKEYLKSWKHSHLKTLKETIYKNKGERVKALLKNILGDNIDNIEGMKDEQKREVRRYGKRAGRIVINLDEELDVNRLKRGDYSILTATDTNKDYPQILQENDNYIFIGDGSISLEDYYEEHKKEFTKEWLLSEDLLKQMLVIYIIKRAQAQDEEAFNMLFKCYKEGAEGLAVNFLRKKAEQYGRRQFDQNGKLSDEEGKSIARQILALHLKGDSPATAIKYLDAKPTDKRNVPILKRKTYEPAMESYEYMFNMIFNQTISLDEQLAVLKKTGKDLKYRAKKSSEAKTKEYYWDRLFTVSQHHLVVARGSLTLFSIINPASLMEISPKFNKLLFKPSKNINLTTWLFGNPDKNVTGMLWYGLEDWFKVNTYEQDGKRRIKDEDYGTESFNDGEYIEDENGYFKKKSIKE